MSNGSSFGRLLWQALTALLLCAALVVLCYFFADRPLAWYVHDQNFPRNPVLPWLTYPPPLLQKWAPVVLVALMIRRAWGPFRRWEQALLAACVSLVLADQFRQTLSYGFGRYWPETWGGHDNPSLIRDGAYGFHPFHSGVEYDSFPSGHTARTLAIAAVVWIVYPRWRWASVVGSVAVAVGLLGMNYHFLGDVIAGGFVGGVVGTYTAHCCGLTEKPCPVPQGKVRSTSADPIQ